MTCRGTNILGQDQGTIIVVISTVVITKTDQGTGLMTDKMPPELGLQVDRGEITLIPDIIVRKKLETIPEGKTEVIIEAMTLAMVGITEGAARRPCFMGGPL